LVSVSVSPRRAIHGSRIGAIPARTSIPTSGSVNGPDVSVTVCTVAVGQRDRAERNANRRIAALRVDFGRGRERLARENVVARREHGRHRIALLFAGMTRIRW
jgi:hypothetical protein